MEFLLIVIVVILAILLSKKSGSQSSNQIDQKNKNYAQGYWDGYRAHQKEAISGVQQSQLANITSQPADTVVSNNYPHQVPTAVFSFGSINESDVKNITPTISQAEQKAKHDNQNINTVLYVASFLLVAAAALFVSTSFPETIRFAGIWLVTLSFYLVGFILYDKVQKLRPAAIAFVGTGLALLPFTGIAMHNLLLTDINISWFITSVIGVFAFTLATVRLKSQVIAYFSIAFMISMATSSVATLGAGLIWYFVVLIGFGSLMTFIAKIKPNWVSECFATPIQQTNQWLVPLTLIASLVAFTGLTTRDYWIITLVSAVYYAAVAVSSSIGREMAVFVARLLASLAGLLIAYDIFGSWVAVGLAMSMIGIIQVAVSFIFLPQRIAGDSNNETWLWIGFIMQLFSLMFVLGSGSWAIIIFYQLLTMLVMSFVVAYMLRRASLTAFGTVALVVLPIIWGLNIISPSIELRWISLIFLSFASIVLAVRAIPKFIVGSPSIRPFLLMNFGIFLIESLAFTASIDAGWGFAIWILAAASIYHLVYIERQPQLLIISNIVMLVSVVWLAKLLKIELTWTAMTVSGIVFCLYYAMYWALELYGKKEYSVYFWVSSMLPLGLVSMVSLASDTLAVAASFGMITLALVSLIDGWRNKRYGMIDLGVVAATIGMQRIINFNTPDINWLVYTHWWAIVVAALAYLYYRAGQKDKAKTRAIFALLFISVSTGMSALGVAVGSSESYQLLFLVEHAIMLISGLIASWKMLTIWGAAGVILAIIWMLSGYGWALLAFVAIILIAGVIFVLIRQPKVSK